MYAVINIVSIASVIDVYVVSFVPCCRLRFRPRINERHPIAIILEARIANFIGMHFSFENLNPMFVVIIRLYFTCLGDFLSSVASNSFAEAGAGTAPPNTMSFAGISFP